MPIIAAPGASNVDFGGSATAFNGTSVELDCGAVDCVDGMLDLTEASETVTFSPCELFNVATWADVSALKGIPTLDVADLMSFTLVNWRASYEGGEE